MSAFATTRRIARQMRNDPRTLALIVVVPAALLTLLYFVFVDVPVPPGRAPLFDRVGPVMLAVLPMVLMFIITSVAMLRERTMGTLERLLTTPLSRANLVGSYAVVFGGLALVQAAVLAALLRFAFDVPLEGSWWALLLLAVLDALIGVTLGLMASAFARTEFQAVQFMPAFVAPQIFLCGLFVPIEQMPGVLEAVAHVLPMTWAVDVANTVITESGLDGGDWLRLAGLLALSVAAVFGAAVTMPRKVA